MSNVIREFDSISYFGFSSVVRWCTFRIHSFSIVGCDSLTSFLSAITQAYTVQTDTVDVHTGRQVPIVPQGSELLKISPSKRKEH